MVAPGTDSAPELTRREREDLAKVARMRARVSRQQLEAHGARVLADFEADLAARYASDDAAWRDLTAAANAAVQAADAELARRCEELGIRPEFRPGLTLGWYRRGENGTRERRAELRKVAQSEVAASIKAAKSAVDVAELEAVTAIIADGLRSEAAREWLERIPTPEQLLAPLDVDSIEAKAPARREVAW